MRSFYTKEISKTLASPLYLKVVLGYLCLSFFCLTVTSVFGVIALNRPDIDAKKVLEIFLASLGSLWLVSTLIFIYVVKPIYQPLRDMVSWTLNIEDLKYIELPDVSTVEITNIYKAFNDAIDRLKLEQKEISKKHELLAIARTTQMLAHDVRKPFTLVSAVIEMVNQSRSSADAKAILNESLPDISSSLASVNGMIHDVMDVGKTELTLSQEPISPAKVIQGALSNIFKYNEAADIKIEYQLRSKHLVLIDSIKIDRVFGNIIGNAVEHMKNKGKIWFHTTEKDGFTLFTLGNSDTYVSIEDSRQLFDAFFTKDKKGGTGLGLAIAKKIVEAHGGQIWCESSREKGTEFLFTLPSTKSPMIEEDLDLSTSSKDFFEATKLKLAKDESASDEDEVQEDEAIIAYNLEASRMNFIRVAIVDDEPIYRNHLRRHLGIFKGLEKKLALEEFSSPCSFLKAVEKGQSYDVIIMDVDFGPGKMKGFEAASKARKILTNAKICIHSNRGSLEYQSQALEVGADLFLPKPMNRMHLLKILASSSGLSDEQMVKPINRNKTLPGKIMVVDDSKSIIRNWNKIVPNENIKTFNSYDEFISFSNNQDLLDGVFAIIVDFYLENDRTGVDIAKYLKESGSKIPVYLSSNKASLEDHEKLLFDDILPKIPSQALNKLTERIEKGFKEPEDLKLSKRSLASKRLLIVEDDRRQLERYSLYAQPNITFDTASNYDEAIEHISSNHYDFILSDVHLTRSLEDKSQGLDVIKYAREKIPDVSICVMSTDTSISNNEIMDHFIEKPIVNEESFIKALIESRVARSRNK